MTDGGIGGKAGKTVRAAALQSESKVREGSGLALGVVGFDETEKSLADGLGNHRGFGSALLLLEDEQRLAEMGVAALDMLEEDRDLRMLAAEAENGSTSDVRMVNITGKQAAEITGILARAAATAFMHQKLYSVHIAKDPGRWLSRLHLTKGERL